MEEFNMPMSANLHTDTNKAKIKLYKLSKCEANVVQIADATFNQVAVFMTLEQMQELAEKLQEYVKLQGGIE